MMPKRIQRRRTKGWRMPEGAVYVGRPSKWGNPFTPPFGVGPGDARQSAADAYRRWLHDERPDLIADAKRELRGKDLVCWCWEYFPCHADVLLGVANS